MCIRDRYDALGRSVFSTSLAQGQDQHEFFLDEIKNGIYFYTIVQDEERLDSGKIIFSKY